MRPHRLSIALCILAACVSAFAFALVGCGSEDEMSAEAEAVSYEPSGAYTTTLTAREGVSMADLTAADLQVGYPVIDPDPVEGQGDADGVEGDGTAEAPADAADAAPASTAATPGADGAETPIIAANPTPSDSAAGTTDDVTGGGSAESGDGDGEETSTTIVFAEVRDFTVNDDGTATLSFEDPAAAEHLPPIYSVYAERIGFSTQVCVNYPSFTLKPDLSYVAASSGATRLTLALEEGEFNPTITRDAIVLGGSFEKMAVENLSSAGRNLTLQLTGTPTATKAAGVYLPGSVGVRPEAIAHASQTTYASVPVHVDGAALGASALRVEGGAVTIPVTLYGIADPATLAPDQVSITGGAAPVAVRGVQPAGENRVTLTLDVPGAATANAAARALDGQTLRVGAHETTIALPEAGFYPVLDYVGKVGDNLELTLVAYANSGSFAIEPAVVNVSLSGGFAGGTVTSVERSGDTTLRIRLTIPAGDRTPETLDVTGTVTLAAGTLSNVWGEPTDVAASCTRSYSQASLGRSDDAATFVSRLTSAVESSPFTSAVNAAGTGSDAYDDVMNLLAVCGFAEDPDEQVLAELREIEGTLNEVKRILEDQTKVMLDTQREFYIDRCDAFETALDRLANDNETVGEYFSHIGELDVPMPPKPAGASEEPEAAEGRGTAGGPTAPESPAAVVDPGTAGGPGAPEDRGSAEDPEVLRDPEVLEEQGVPLAREASATGASDDQAWGAYLGQVIQAMYDADRVGNGTFDGFSQAMANLEASYLEVAGAVARGSDATNPLYSYDYLCSMTYNFDSIALPYRQGFRATVTYQLERALGFLNARYNKVATPTAPKVSEMARAFSGARVQLNRRKVTPTDDVLFYLPGVFVQPRLDLPGTLADSRGDLRNVNSQAILGWGNLSEAQAEEFVKRMSGRTGLEELDLAGFNISGNVRTEGTGFGLRLWVTYEKRGAFRYDDDRSMANLVKWNGPGLVKDYEVARYRYDRSNPFLDPDGYDIENAVVVPFLLAEQ